MKKMEKKMKKRKKMSGQPAYIKVPNQNEVFICYLIMI